VSSTRSSTWSVVFAALATASVLVSCQIVGRYDDFSGKQDAGRRTTCAALTTRSKLAQHGSRLLLIDNQDEACFWMDATEVSVADYRIWLASLGGAAPQWSPACAWKANPPYSAIFNPDGPNNGGCAIPASQLAPFEASKPMRCVDWCEAQAFCEWAGKRLCFEDSGATGLEPPRETNEWSIACSLNGALAWPFDTTAAVPPCNFNQPVVGCSGVDAICGPWPPGSSASCQPGPGYPYDLGGNVSEWVDLCESGHTPTDECHHRGGYYDSTLADLACAGIKHAPRGSHDPSRGFRCCASLSQEELGMLTP
jgi:formylglycine-generating enzyme required for sulfatase activity